MSGTLARKCDGDPLAGARWLMRSWPISCWARSQAEVGGAAGPNGLPTQVTKAVLERALAEEMTGRLWYHEHDSADRESENSRNGMTGKTVLTDVGAVDLEVPRDRAGTWGRPPRWLNERIIAPNALGMPPGTSGHTRARRTEWEVSPDLISRVTDGVLEVSLAGVMLLAGNRRNSPNGRPGCWSGLPSDLHRCAQSLDGLPPNALRRNRRSHPGLARSGSCGAALESVRGALISS